MVKGFRGSWEFIKKVGKRAKAVAHKIWRLTRRRLSREEMDKSKYLEHVKELRGTKTPFTEFRRTRTTVKNMDGTYTQIIKTIDAATGKTIDERQTQFDEKGRPI